MNRFYYTVAKKVFVKGFYKAHSGALFFLVSVIAFYFFFIGALDKLPDNVRLSWNLVFARLMLDSWNMVGIFAFMSILYVSKSCQYVLTEMYKDKNVSIHYCSQCVPKRKLFAYWMMMQAQIQLPLLVYSLFVSCAGLLFGYSIRALFLFGWFVLLLGLSTFFCMYLIYRKTHFFEKWNLLSGNFFRKPLYSLFCWHLLDKLKLMFVLTKLTSWTLISGAFLATGFGNGSNNYNYFVASIIAMSNSLLVFKEYQFTKDYLYWSYNFPAWKGSFFFSSLLSYILFLSPELLWIVHYFNWKQAVGLIFWMLAILAVYRGTLYAVGANMQTFIQTVFVLFLVFYFFSIYGATPFLIPVLMVIGFVLFSLNYPLKSV